jgi:hypothetical protein
MPRETHPGPTCCFCREYFECETFFPIVVRLVVCIEIYQHLIGWRHVENCSAGSRWTNWWGQPWVIRTRTFQNTSFEFTLLLVHAFIIQTYANWGKVTLNVDHFWFLNTEPLCVLWYCPNHLPVNHKSYHHMPIGHHHSELADLSHETLIQDWCWSIQITICSPGF